MRLREADPSMAYSEVAKDLLSDCFSPISFGLVHLTSTTPNVRLGWWTGEQERETKQVQPNSHEISPVFKTCRRNFIGQYLQLRKASRNSTTGFRVAFRKFSSYRKAWKAGIGTLRGLYHFTVPPDLGDVLSFLAIAKAIAETLRDEGGDYLDEFKYDLAQWERIFTDEASHRAYLEALKLTWNLTIDCFEWRPKSPNHDQILLDLRDSAAKLVLQANAALGVDDPCADTNPVGLSTDPKSRLSCQARSLNHLVAPHIAQVEQRALHDANFTPVLIGLLTGVIFSLVVYYSEGRLFCAFTHDNTNQI